MYVYVQGVLKYIHTMSNMESPCNAISYLASRSVIMWQYQVENKHYSAMYM